MEGGGISPNKCICGRDPHLFIIHLGQQEGKGREEGGAAYHSVQILIRIEHVQAIMPIRTLLSLAYYYTPLTYWWQIAIIFTPSTHFIHEARRRWMAADE